jgi:uncharacterized membrane protein
MNWNLVQFSAGPLNGRFNGAMLFVWQNVRFGSFATDVLGAPLGTMSAVLPKADIRF